MVKNKTVNEVNTELAWKIYAALNAKGADLGNVSVSIIANVLNRFTPAPAPPAVDWRAVAKQAAIMLEIVAENFHDTRHSGSFKDCKISACVKSREVDAAYERALAAEAGPEQASG